MAKTPDRPDDYTPYEPLGTLKPVGENIWIVDGPVLKWGYGGWQLPFPTRMTVIRLHDGGLWLHSPVAPDENLVAEIEALGAVRHLVSPNKIHHVSLEPWSKRFPEAKVWASPGVRRRSAVNFTDDLTDEPPTEWRAEIDQRIAYGSSAMEEVVFFHHPSRTLILADLIENFELERTSGWFNRLLIKIGRVHQARPPIDFQLSFLFGRKRFRPVVEWMLANKPERIIIAHGKWIEKDTQAALTRAFGWAL